MEWIKTSQEQSPMEVCYKSLICVFHYPFTFSFLHLYYVPFHTSRIYVMKHSSSTIHCRVISLPAFPPRLYHSPISYCICRPLSSNLTWTIFIFTYVFLHTISYFLLRSIFPSSCILSLHFSLNTPVPPVTDGQTSGTKNIEIKKNSCVCELGYEQFQYS